MLLFGLDFCGTEIALGERVVWRTLFRERLNVTPSEIVRAGVWIPGGNARRGFRLNIITADRNKAIPLGLYGDAVAVRIRDRAEQLLGPVWAEGPE